MSNINLTKDKSWMIVFALLFFAPPIGFVALIAKIIFTVYSAQNTSKTMGSRTSSSTWDTSKTDASSRGNSYREELLDIEEDLKDAFEQWQEKDYETITEPIEVTIEASDVTYEAIDQVVEGSYEPMKTTEVELVEAPFLTSGEGLSTEGLEAQLNISTEALEIDDIVVVDSDVDLTINDVHIDTEITFDDESEDHNHEGQEPLKVVTCTMCGTENAIYKIDIFETPQCEKCGMLLLDR